MLALSRATRKLPLAIMVAALFAASGCSSLRPAIDPLPGSAPLSADKLFGAEAAAETEFPIDWSAESMFVLHRPETSAILVPKIQVKNLSFTEVGVADAVRLLAAQAGLAVRVDGGAMGSERYGPVTMENLSGSFEDVLNEMASAAGFFWEIKGKTLIVRQDELFIVNLPPVLAEDTMAGVTNTMQFLGARDVFLDRAGRTLTFSANQKGMDQIQRYLENIRATRSMLVYDTHVFQVDLNDGMNTGINWSQLGYATNTAGLAGGPGQVTGQGLLDRVGDKLATAALNSTVNGIGLAISAPKFSIGGLINFLNTQGTVKSLSSPQITMLSGSKGSLRVGKTIQFVSKVGSNTTTGISQVTTETTSLRVGLALQLQGDLYDKTVFTRVNLTIADVTDWVKYTAIGTDLTLPQSADRDLDVSVRSRPGDVVLLGGIHIDTDSKTVSRGATGVTDVKSRARSELVLVLKARVIKFVGKKPEPLALPAAPADAALTLTQ